MSAHDTDEICPHCGDTLSPKAHGEGLCDKGAVGEVHKLLTLAGAEFHARKALRKDNVDHQIREWTEPDEIAPTTRHRIVINGEPGPWVGRAQIAVNGVYRGNSGYYDCLPRLFVAIDLVPEVHEHRTEDRS